MIQNEMLSPHFSLKEMTDSQTAVKHGIANIPSPEAVANLRRLCQGTLEPLREALQLPVVITNAFRSKALNNKLAHSSKRSQHMKGQAADFYVGKGSREELIKAFHQILIDPKIDFDQLILYSNFIHVSYVSPKVNRRGILIGMRNGKLGYGRISLSNALLITY